MISEIMMFNSRTTIKGALNSSSIIKLISQKIRHNQKESLPSKHPASSIQHPATSNQQPATRSNMHPGENESVSFEWKSSIGLFAQGSRPDDLYYSQNPNLYQYLGQDDEFMRLARPRFERIDIQITEETEIPIENSQRNISWSNLSQRIIPNRDYNYAVRFDRPRFERIDIQTIEETEIPIENLQRNIVWTDLSKLFLIPNPDYNYAARFDYDEDFLAPRLHLNSLENEENQEDLSFLIVYSEIPKGRAQKKIRSLIDQYSGSRAACSKMIGWQPEWFRYLLV